ncbi:MAG: hypothetical protein IK152_00860 [Lachnospiraceae bacterium]|nr:hypothetical protein [Lachnospiraceae bacterium]
MKKRLIALMAAAVIVVASFATGCGGSGSNGGSSKAAGSSAAGSAAASSAAASSSVASSAAGLSEEAKAVVGSWASESLKDYIYTFNEDGTGDYAMGTSKKELTFKVADGKLEILFKGDTAPFKTPVKVEGNKLIIKDSFDKDVVYIKK